MPEPVDLKNLREMTDGDKEMEKALFREFFLSFDEAVKALKGSLEVSATETWRKSAHALKGISLNLGAQKLGELCKKAQEECASSPDAKRQMLSGIEVEYEKVRQFLNGLI